MSFGGDAPAVQTPALASIPEQQTVAPTPEEIARQAKDIRRRRRSVADLIVEPAANVDGAPGPVRVDNR